MSSRWKYWWPAALLLAGAALGQPTDKPVFRVAEPERTRADSRSVQVVAIDWPRADAKMDGFPKALPTLLAYLHEVPGLGVRAEWQRQGLQKPLGQEVTLLYMTGSHATMTLSEAEKSNLGKALQQGAMLFAEEIRQSTSATGLEGMGTGVTGTPFDRQFKGLMRDPLVLGSQGERWEKIPHNHPLYSCFFEFSDGPPLGGALGGSAHDLEMLQLRGRPAVIFSDLNISWYWGDPLVQNRERGLQFGVNLLVFALTQGAAR